jgi:hypothetical protein
MEAVVTLNREPVISIEGVRLNEAQALTVRVAVTELLAKMRELDALGEDDQGRALAAAYAARSREILHLMFVVGAR